MEQKRNFDRRNKGGRPKKGAADKLKYRLTVKMATSDYYTLKGKARSVGISAGEFLRRCMRDGQVKEWLTPEHTGYIRQLCGMANNLNQIVHKANAAGFVTVRMECRILVARIEELLNLISGRSGALLPLSPLRTVRDSFPSYGSSGSKLV